MTLRHLLAGTAAVLGLLACTADKSALSDGTQIAATQPVLGSFGVALENMDLSVRPGDNFFKFVNGRWLDTTDIPEDKSSYGGFAILADLSDARVKKIIEDISKNGSSPGSEAQKIGDFYASFTDVDAINAAGLSAVEADLAKIANVKNHKEAAYLMGDPQLNLRAPISGWVDVDVKNISEYIFYITQSGLGMPSKDNYLDKDEKALKLRTAYKTFLEHMLTKAGYKSPKKRAGKVLAFETEMAKVHWSPEKRRDRSLTYNKMAVDALKSYAEGFEWQDMFEAAGLARETEFVVRENDAIQALSRIFAKTDIETLKAYMAAHYLSTMAAFLPDDVDQARFDFYGKALRGTQSQRARWKRGVGQIDDLMGEMVGKVYVERHFPPKAKSEMDDLVENLRAAFKDGIDNLDWMGAKTKIEAQDKLRKFNPKIGYPNEWSDYSSLIVKRGDLIGSVKSANLWQWEDMTGKLGGPIDRGEWGMNPQTVNAYYRPSLNEIVFPAAILQAPFFDTAADPAVNYGGIGAVIGHEMGHGFDDQGRKTDGDGRQRDWWTDADGAAFKARADILVEQFNAFEPLPGLHINGELTLGENIGDLTGLTMAYTAYKKSLGGVEPPIIDGFTGDQRFFLAYGQIWQRKFREAALRNRIKTDPHSPGEYRANGIVRNFDPWYAAFNVGPDDALYLPPEKRVKIW